MLPLTIIGWDDIGYKTVYLSSNDNLILVLGKSHYLKKFAIISRSEYTAEFSSTRRFSRKNSAWHIDLLILFIVIRQKDNKSYGSIESR